MHIVVPDAYPCAFCDYLAGRRPYTVLRRDSITATLVTREQRGVSHLLILPVRHCATILDLEADESAAVAASVIDAARAIDLAEQRPGIAVWQNNGIPAGQAIPHVHFHVAGTLPEGGTIFGPVPELSIDETNAIGKRVAPFLRGHNISNSGGPGVLGPT